MIRYSLKELARKPKGTRVRLPGIHSSWGDEVAYLKILRQMLRELATYVRDNVIPAYRSLRPIITDATDRVWEELNLYARALSRVASTMVGRVLRSAAGRHSATWLRGVQRTLGVDLAAIVRDSDISAPLEIMAQRSAELITKLSGDIIADIKQKALSALLEGRSGASLAIDLNKTFKLGERRAKVIARDQISKNNADLTQLRHQQAGIEEYEWNTVEDERVRPLHASLDNKVYKYGEKTGAEDGLPPGRPILCRCIAIAIIQF